MLITPLSTLHRFLRRRSCYSLLVVSLAAAAMLHLRFYVTSTHTYGWMMWNLGLAWVPYTLSLVITDMARRKHYQALAALLTGFWLLLFPNAPYLTTDVIHLSSISSAILWFDVGLLMTFAWAGCLLGIVSLQLMQTLVQQLWGTFRGWLFVLGTIGISSMGIYLGRFKGWNSWDLLLHPWSVVADSAGGLVHPFQHQRQVGFTLLFATFLLVAYLSVPHLSQHPDGGSR